MSDIYCTAAIGIDSLSPFSSFRMKLEHPLSRKPSLGEILEYIVSSGKGTLRIVNWEAVCRLLGVESKDIESAKRDRPNNSKEAFQFSLRVWHKGSTGVPVTWEKLLEAVEGAGESKLAAEVKRKLEGGGMTTPPTHTHFLYYSNF